MKRKLLWIIVCILTLYGWMSLSSCSEEDSPYIDKDEEVYTGVPLIIFDTDIGSSTDDLFALEMLHHHQDNGRCKLLGVIVDLTHQRMQNTTLPKASVLPRHSSAFGQRIRTSCSRRWR